MRGNREGEDQEKREWPVFEWVAVAFFVSGMFAFLFPAVRQAARAKGGEVVAIPWVDDRPLLFALLFPIGVAGGAALLLEMGRSLLPEEVRQRFPWFRRREKVVVQIPIDVDWLASLMVDSIRSWMVAIGLLLVGAWHARVDRSHRNPVITWDGPLGAYGGWCVSVSVLFSVLAFVLMVAALSSRRDGWVKHGVTALLLCLVDAVMTMGVLAGLYGD